MRVVAKERNEVEEPLSFSLSLSHFISRASPGTEIVSYSYHIHWHSTYQITIPSHQSLAGLDTQDSQEGPGHVARLMSSARAHRAFIPSSSPDSTRQHKDRQKKMSSYFASGLPYSRYY